MDQNPKQLIAEKLRNSGSFLITVSKSPSVDQLASALGLSLMLAALNKHATTVFSGEIPNTMEFLEPEKLIDPSVDSLRDFIISISKDKADKLRYKVEDDVVKIYITPYKGKIDENDLKFSQGDLMVDAVIALGVMKRDELDSAISNHGKILHDAAILTITAGKKESSLGSVNWNDENASSISEMLVSISEALQGNLLDAQMATAFLTGIVSATDRFSNKKTSPKVMTMAAQLMAAGANQQLIATNLELDHIDHGVPAHENESVDVHEDEKNETDDESGQENQADDKPQQPPENQSNGTDSSGDVKQEVASDASLSLKEIENKLHAHEDELSKHDSMPIDKNIQPPAEQHHEDPAIEALEDEIDHDPVENLRNIEESIHPGQTSFRTAASPPPQPVAPPQTAQQTPPTFQMPQNQSPQQPQEQFQGQPQQQPFPEQTQPSTQAPQQQFPQSTQSMNIPQSAPPSQYPQSMQQEQEAQQPAPPPQPQPETRQRVEEPPQAMQQEQQVSRQITGMQQAHDPLESRQPRRVFGTDDSDEPALQYGNQNMEPLTHSQIGGVKGQGPKQTFEAPALGGTFNATSNEAQKESEKQMNGDINNELLSHRRAQQQDQQPQEQSGDMLSQARQEVEQAVQSSPSPVGETPTSIQPQPIPGATQGPGEIAIDESGTFNLNASQPPSAPPPLPPNPQMNSPQPQANQPPPPPTSPMTPPPPGNVGQMYIPPQQPNSRPNEAQENPFNL